MNVEFYQDEKGEHRWRVTANNNEIVAASTEGFTTKQNCKINLELTADVLNGYLQYQDQYGEPEESE